MDSAKVNFGILFSKNGISGEGKAKDADRDRLKVFLDRGLVIIIISHDDLVKVSNGESFLNFLRKKYEGVRFDLRGEPES